MAEPEPKQRRTSSPVVSIVDLRTEQAELLDSVYQSLLQVHFPVADELDDLEDMRTNLAKEPDGRYPELHMLVAKSEDRPMACCYYEYYPPGNFVLLSYLCVLDEFRGCGVARSLIASLEEEMNQRTGGRPLDAIFAETHQVKVEDGIMDAGLRQKVLKSLGFRCLKYDYVQPPLSEKHKPCGGLRLIVKGRESLDPSIIVSYLDNFAGSVFEYDDSWKTEQYYIDQVAALKQLTSVETTGELPW
jgi:GNAT superfamily N-acetyltransferase